MKLNLLKINFLYVYLIAVVFSAAAAAQTYALADGGTAQKRFNAVEREKRLFKSLGIKSFSCYEYEVGLGQCRRAAKLLHSSHYDDGANIKYTIHYDDKGRSAIKDTYYYDGAGNKIAKIIKNARGAAQSKWLYKYDGSNKIIRMTLFGETNEILGRWTFKYDKDLNPVEIIESDGDDDIFNRSVSVYAKNKIFETNYNSENAVDNKRTYTLDGGGKKIEAVLYDQAGVEKIKTYFSYDTAENLIENAAYYPDGGMSFKFTHKYDSENMLIEKTSFDKSGNPDKIYIYTYEK